MNLGEQNCFSKIIQTNQLSKLFFLHLAIWKVFPWELGKNPFGELVKKR